MVSILGQLQAQKLVLDRLALRALLQEGQGEEQS